MDDVWVQHRFMLIACHFEQTFSWTLDWLWFTNILHLPRYYPSHHVVLITSHNPSWGIIKGQVTTHKGKAIPLQAWTAP